MKTNMKTRHSLLSALNNLLKSYSWTACMFRLTALLCQPGNSPELEHKSELEPHMLEPLDIEQALAVYKPLSAEAHMCPFAHNLRKLELARLA